MYNSTVSRGSDGLKAAGCIPFFCRAQHWIPARTIEGPGTGTEIRVALQPTLAGQVDVTVEFHVPETRPARLAALGDSYAVVYARLWDEDEAMMQARKRALARRFTLKYEQSRLDLGNEQLVRATLALLFDFGGEAFRLVALDGELVARSTTCPQGLGPLGEAMVADGEVRCPWHGYRFNVVSGTCAAHSDLKLAPAPAIRIEAGRIAAERN